MYELNSMVAGALSRLLATDQLDQFADVLQALDLGGLELDLEAHFARDDDVDVIQRIPFVEVFGGTVHRQIDIVVVEYVAEDVDQFAQDLVVAESVHDDSAPMVSMHV